MKKLTAAFTLLLMLTAPIQTLAPMMGYSHTAFCEN